MTNHEAQLNAAGTPETKARLLQRIRGPVEERDNEVVEHWRNVSPAAHAEAMIQLARYAEQMVAITGLGKDPSEPLPNISDLLTQRSA